MMNLIEKVQAFLFPLSMNESLEAINFSEKFISLSINNSLEGPITQNRIIQLVNSNGVRFQYILSKEKEKTKIESFENNKLISFSENHDLNLTQTYIDKIAELFHFSMDKSIEILNNDSEISSDLSNETKGLEWIRVSLVVLKSAITKSIEDPTLSFNGQFFSGRRRENEHYQLRIHCLSLDFLLEFLNDGRLRVSVWNYKDQKPNSKVEPDFLNEFVKLKQSVFDEFIQLLVLMSKASTKI